MHEWKLGDVRGNNGDVSKCAWGRCLSFNQPHWVAFIAIGGNYAATHALEKIVKYKAQTLTQYLHNKCALSTKDKRLRDTTSSHFIRKTSLGCYCYLLSRSQESFFWGEARTKVYWNKPHALVEIPHAMLHNPRSDENVKGGQCGRRNLGQS